MKHPRCIRIFYSKKDAERAKGILFQGDIESYITEDKFGELSLDKLGMYPRFRLYIDMDDINRAGEYLATLLLTIKSEEG